MPTSRLSTVGSRAFPVAGPQIWNDLPEDVTSAESLTTFRRLLKTHLLRKSFPDYFLDVNRLSPVDLAVVPLLRQPTIFWLIDWLTAPSHPCLTDERNSIDVRTSFEYKRFAVTPFYCRRLEEDRQTDRRTDGRTATDAYCGHLAEDSRKINSISRDLHKTNSSAFLSLCPNPFVSRRRCFCGNRITAPD